MKKTIEIEKMNKQHLDSLKKRKPFYVPLFSSMSQKEQLTYFIENIQPHSSLSFEEFCLEYSTDVHKMRTLLLSFEEK